MRRGPRRTTACRTSGHRYRGAGFGPGGRRRAHAKDRRHGGTPSTRCACSYLLAVLAHALRPSSTPTGVSSTRVRRINLWEARFRYAEAFAAAHDLAKYKGLGCEEVLYARTSASRRGSRRP